MKIYVAESDFFEEINIKQNFKVKISSRKLFFKRKEAQS